MVYTSNLQEIIKSYITDCSIKDCQSKGGTLKVNGAKLIFLKNCLAFKKINNGKIELVINMNKYSLRTSKIQSYILSQINIENTPFITIINNEKEFIEYCYKNST